MVKAKIMQKMIVETTHIADNRNLHDFAGFTGVLFCSFIHLFYDNPCNLVNWQNRVLFIIMEKGYHAGTI